MLMSLERLGYLLFLEKKIIVILSQNILNNLTIEIMPNLDIKFHNHKTWLVTLKHTTNLAFIIDDAIIYCLALFQKII